MFVVNRLAKQMHIDTGKSLSSRRACLAADIAVGDTQILQTLFAPRGRDAKPD